MTTLNQHLYGFPQGEIQISSLLKYFPPTSSYVVGRQGNFSTIQSAINAAHKASASSANPINILIQAGIYSENITIYDGINLISAVQDIGYNAFLGSYGPPSAESYNSSTSVILAGTINLDASAIATNTLNVFSGLTIAPATGNAINFFTNTLTVDAFVFIGCIIYVNGSNNTVFAVDGYPNIHLLNCSVYDNGSTGNKLFGFPGSSGFLNISATQTNFIINAATPCILPSGAYIQTYLNSCNWHVMINATASPISFAINAQASTFSSVSSDGSVAMFNFGNQLGRIQLDGCYVNQMNGPLVSLTSTDPAAFVVINNCHIKGTVAAPNYIITNSDFLSNGTNYSEIYKGIGTAYQGSQQIKSQAGVQTTNATATTLGSVVVNEGESIVLQGTIIGAQSDHSNAVGGNFLICARRASGGNVTLVGSVVTNVETSSAATFTCDVDTGTQTARIRVTGVAATTYNWIATYSYTKVLTSA